MARKVLINGQIYEETGSRKIVSSGVIYQSSAGPVAIDDSYQVISGTPLVITAGGTPPGILNNDTSTCN